MELQKGGEVKGGANREAPLTTLVSIQNEKLCKFFHNSHSYPIMLINTHVIEKKIRSMRFKRTANSAQYTYIRTEPFFAPLF